MAKLQRCDTKKNPPTPAFAKAGAAPGTTAGVELFRAHSPLSLRYQQAQHAPLPHTKATTRPQQWLKSTPRPQQWLLIRVQGCRLPGLKRSKTLQNPPNPPKVRPAPQGKGTPTSPTRATAARKSHHKATAMAQGHPTASAMASYTRSRLPFARPQTLQNPPKPSQPSNSPASSARKRYPNKPNTRHSRTQKPPQGHSNGSRAPHGRSNGFLYAFKAAVCQASNAPKPSKPSKSPASSARKRYPNKPNTRHSRTQKPPQGHSNGSRAPHGRSNGFLYAFKAAVCQASNAPKPSKTLQTLQKSALQTLQKSGQLRKEKVPQQAQHAPLPHAKATTRPQQWLKSTPRPQQWLLIRVQGCRLPGLKRSKTLQNPPNPPKVRPAPQGKGTPTSPTRATAARKSHHKATAMAQGHHTAAAMASYTRSRLPFARLQTLQNPPNPPKVRPAPQGKGTPTSPTRATPARKSHHKATAMAQGHPTAAAMASYTRSRLPFARPQTLQNPPNPPKVRPAPQGKGVPCKEKVPQQAQHAPLPHAKATTRPQQWVKSTPRPQQWLLIRVQGCRLPGLKRSKTLQNPPNPPKSPASSAGKRYPNKPNTRHCRTQKPPQGHSNGSRAPHGRSNGFLYAFKAAVCQASNAPNPPNPPNPPKVRPAPQGKGTPTSPTRATPARKSHHKATAMAQGRPTAAAMASYRR